MPSLKDVLITELLDALDTIQQKVPVILEHSLDHDIDLDILTMHIISLRDTVNLLAMDIEPEAAPCSDSLCDTISSSISQATCSDSLCDTISSSISPATCSDSLCDTISISPAMKQAALALFFHTHMLTDPESIYHSPGFGQWPSLEKI